MSNPKPEFHADAAARILDVIERIDSDPGDKALDELHQLLNESPETERRVIDTTRQLHTASVVLASEHSIDEWVEIAKEGFAADALGFNEAAQTAPPDTLGHLAGRPTLTAAPVPWYVRRAKPIALAAAVAGVGILAPFWYLSQADASKIISLPDTSSMRRYAQSRVDVNYSAEERRVDVERGGAAFEVKHDQQGRPFNVYAGDLVIAAKGTQFNVYRRPGLTDVYLEQGSLKVLHKQEPLLTMKEGDLVHINDHGSLEELPRHELRVGGMTYLEIAAEFNKENAVLRFVVEGDARALRVPAGNVAELTAPAAWIAAIQADPALHVTSKLGVVTIEAAPSN